MLAAPALRQLPPVRRRARIRAWTHASCTIRRSCAGPTDTASSACECATLPSGPTTWSWRACPARRSGTLAPTRDGVGRQVAARHLRADEGSASATAARRSRRSSTTTRTTSSSRGAGRPGADREPAPGTQEPLRRADRARGSRPARRARPKRRGHDHADCASTASTARVDVDPEMPLLWALRDVARADGHEVRLRPGAVRRVHGAPRRRRGARVRDAGAARRRSRVTTIEGLSPDGTIRCSGRGSSSRVPQCGFCQAGQIMTAAALLAGEARSRATRRSITSMAGNLCRCGTYTRIRAAVRKAAEAGR